MADQDLTPDTAPLRLGVSLNLGHDVVLDACHGVPGVELVSVEDPAALPEHAGALDALVIQNHTFTRGLADALRERPGLAWIQSTATGIDAFQRHGLSPGVRLTNAGATWADPVADHTLALLLGLARHLPRLERDRQAHRWDRAGLACALAGLHRRRILVVGFGPIGQTIAKRLHGFDAQVTALTLTPKPDAPYVQRLEAFDRLAAHLPEAVILALLLTPQTGHMIDAAALAAMRPDAILVNVSRGDLIDEPSLIAALDAGHLRGAGLDVAATEPLPADSPLWRFERVIISPHTAIVDDGLALAGLAALCRENPGRFINGQALLNEVALAAL